MGLRPDFIYIILNLKKGGCGAFKRFCLVRPKWPCGPQLLGNPREFCKSRLMKSSSTAKHVSCTDSEYANSCLGFWTKPVFERKAEQIWNQKPCPPWRRWENAHQRLPACGAHYRFPSKNRRSVAPAVPLQGPEPETAFRALISRSVGFNDCPNFLL